jgi:hypothetical protein
MGRSLLPVVVLRRWTFAKTGVHSEGAADLLLPTTNDEPPATLYAPGKSSLSSQIFVDSLFILPQYLVL